MTNIPLASGLWFNFRSRGFTLLEMMATVGIVGLVMALAIPDFSAYLQRQGVRSAGETITRSISEARSHALTRLVGVTMCWNASDQDSMIAGVDVAARTIVSFIPAGVDGAAQEDLAEQSFGGGNAFIESNDDGCVGFDSQGRMDATTVPGAGLVFGVCKSDAGSLDDAIVISVGPSGRPTSSKNTGAINELDCS